MNYSEIKDKLLQERKKALIEKNEPVKSIISLIVSRLDLLNKECLLKEQELTEVQIISALSSELKQTKESLIEAEKFKREESIIKLNKQIEFIETLLPKQLNEEEIKESISKILSELSIAEFTKKDFGIVMKTVSSELKGKADGKLVNSLVRSFLVEA